jgi:deoxycytidine triphosphate deaminase/addiction module HigA family antidote
MLVRSKDGAEADAVGSGGACTPGEHLRAEIERLGLDQIKVSEATDVSRQSINNIINGRQPISRAMAGKLGRLTGQSSDYWLRAEFPRPGAAPSASVAAGNTGHSLGVGILVNHQIVHAVAEGIIAIEPFVETNVQLASIDFTLDDFIITTDGGKIDITEEQGFELKPGRAVNAGTKEWVGFPRDYIGRVGGMTRLASLGIMISHGFQIDPGFEGSLQFCVFNAGTKNFLLRGGDPIISLEIMPLSAIPTHDERATKHLREASDRDKIVSIFRSDICEQLIREAIRARTKVEMRGNSAKARIAELAIEFEAPSADQAVDAVVHGALTGVKALRDHPAGAQNEREKYTGFFEEVADGLYFNAEQARKAIACLGFPLANSDAVVVTLRDGKEAILHLPTGKSVISLRQLAKQLRDNTEELILTLAGFRRLS